MVIAGVDEAGRGPWAGPVVAVAVILDTPISGVTDSKALSEKKRESLFTEITDNAISYAIGISEASEIDSLNIHQATLLAMNRAINGLTVTPQQLLIDGLHAPQTTIPYQCIVKGDMLEHVIGAASILAKVTRDRMMLQLDEMYPQYGFAKHKGYGTKQHKEAIEKFGPCKAVHRFSYKPIRATLQQLHLAES